MLKGVLNDPRVSHHEVAAIPQSGGGSNQTSHCTCHAKNQPKPRKEKTSSPFKKHRFLHHREQCRHQSGLETLTVLTSKE